MRTWRRAAARRRDNGPRCITGGERIPRSEPDVTLTHHKAAGVLHYHERCAVDAYKAVVGGEPRVWQLTHRHVDPEAK